MARYWLRRLRNIERRNAPMPTSQLERMHKNTGGRAFSAHTRAPADRNAALKSFTISILVGECSAFLASGREPTVAHQRVQVA